MIISTKKYSEKIEEEKEEREEKKDDSFKSFIFSYKYLLILIVVLVLIILFIFLKSNNKKVEKNVKHETIVFYENESETYNYSLNGLKTSGNFNYYAYIKDPSVADIQNQITNDDNIQFTLKSYNTGKTTLNLYANDGKDMIQESLDVVVCKKISIDKLSSNKIYLKPGTNESIILDVGVS